MFLLLLVAVLCGFVMGIYQRKSTSSKDDDSTFQSTPKLLQGFTYLLRDEADVELDEFISGLDVNSTTLETHLAVGNLFRRKGEVSRAIRIHQNLIARPGLPLVEQRLAQLELARDYAHAGLLDRAERLLLELYEDAHDDREKVAELLVEIYQDEREWQKAIDVVKDFGRGWFGRLAEPWATIQAHYFCELAEQAMSVGNLLEVRRLLDQARHQYKALPRAILLGAELELLAGNYPECFRLLSGLESDQQVYLLVSVSMLTTLAEKGDLNRPVIELLFRAHAQTGIAGLLLAAIKLESETHTDTELLLQALNKTPNLRLLNHYLLTVSNSPSPLAPLNSALLGFQKRLEALPSYRCGRCGFVGKQMHWLCPSCKTWGNLAPIRGLEGA